MLQKKNMMKHKIIFTMLFIAFLVNGCASIREVKPVSSVMSTEPTGKVVLMRNYSFIGAGIYFWATLNGEDIAGIYTDQHTIFSLSQGEYSLGVRCRGAWTLKWELDEIIANVEHGKTYYYLLSENESSFFIPLWDTCADIKEIKEDEGKRILEKSVFVAPGTNSDERKVFPR